MKYIISIAIVILFIISVAHADENKLFWDANTEPDLKGYRIYGAIIISADVSSTMELIANVDKGTTSYAHTIPEDENWIYVVFAVDMVGNVSEPSNMAWRWDRLPPDAVVGVR